MFGEKSIFRLAIAVKELENGNIKKNLLILIGVAQRLAKLQSRAIILRSTESSDGSRAVYAAAYAVRPTAPRRAAW